MTTQEAKICPTCQFVAATDQDDHSCLDHLRKVNNELITERAKLYDLLGRLKAIADEALSIYVTTYQPSESNDPAHVAEARYALSYMETLKKKV